MEPALETGGRPALGAFRPKPGPATSPTAPGDAASGAGRAGPATADAADVAEVRPGRPGTAGEASVAARAGGPATSGEASVAARAGGPATSGEASVAARAGGAVAPQPSAAPAAAADLPTALVFPSRDDLVTAWADHVLPRLRPHVRAVYAVGRFISSEDGTVVFALPNAAHVEHADPLREEVAAALGGHFGGRLGLRLVTDAGAVSDGAFVVAPARDVSPVNTAGAAGEASPARPVSTGQLRGGAGRSEPSAVADFDSEVGETAGRHDPLEWAQSRLLKEFPGAEEVSDGK